MKIFGSILVMFLLGCGGKTYITNDKIYNDKISNRNLFVLPIGQYNISTAGLYEHLKDDFKNEENVPYNQILADSFNILAHKIIVKNLNKNKATLMERLDKYVPESDSGLKKVSKGYETSSNPRYTKFYIPIKKDLEFNKVNTDLTIVFSEVKFYLDQSGQFRPGMVIGSTPAGGQITTGGGSSSSRHLHIQFDFILWDYNKNDFIAYGSSHASASAKFAVVKSDWTRIMKSSLSDMVNKLPLK